MKSTGLFGKNSGRVGGVVYSNYRGQQVVRSYQPQVKNPNTTGQVAQRAKFKLVSQVSASLSTELKSFTPKKNETPRNAWVSKMLKKTVFDSTTKQAFLPIEDIVLTNGYTGGYILSSAQDRIQLVGFSSAVRVHEVIIGYTEGADISLVSVKDYEPSVEGETALVIFETPTNFGANSNVRRLVFAYDYSEPQSYTAYYDYLVSNEKVTLDTLQKTFGTKLIYGETLNLSLPQNV